MSSLLTKLVTSLAVASFVSNDKNVSNILNLNTNEILCGAFLGTYTIMDCFDIYRSIYGTTKIVTTQDSVGHFICKKYNVQYTDTDTKTQLKVISGFTSAVIGYYCTGDIPMKYFTMGMIGGDIIADALNLDPIITAHEIDGDDFFVIV